MSALVEILPRRYFRAVAELPKCRSRYEVYIDWHDITTLAHSIGGRMARYFAVIQSVRAGGTTLTWRADIHRI